MKTSLNELKETEDYLLKRSSPEDRGLFRAKMILDPDLRQHVRAQQQTYDIVAQYGRNQLRKEIETVHQTLFQEPEYQGFRRKILGFFSGR